MPHPLVIQLRFTRNEWQRSLLGVNEEEGLRRFEPINSIGWMVGHLAWHEQLYWLKLAQGKKLVPDLDGLVASGLPASTPSLGEMWEAWHKIMAEVDPYLDTLTTDTLLTHYKSPKGRQARESIGTMLRRVTYHYWFHIGEAQAVRQMLGHTDLPQFVGYIGREAPYQRE